LKSTRTLKSLGFWAPSLMASAALCLAVSAKAETPTKHRFLLVTLPDGKPAVGTQVRVFLPATSSSLVSDFGSQHFEGTIDSDGRVPVALPAWRPLLLVLNAPGAAPAVVELQGEEVELRLATGESISGRVTGVPTGALVAGRVCARWSESPPNWSREFRFERCSAVSRDHSWLISGVSGSSVNLDLEIEGFLPESRLWSRAPEGITFQATPGHLIVGQIVDPAGQWIRDARITAEGATAVGLDEKGQFRIAVPGFPVSLAITAPGLRPEVVPVARQPEAGWKIRLEWGQQVRGVMIGPDRQPLNEAELVAYRWIPENSGWQPIRIPVPIAEDGAFVVDLPTPGDYRLSFRAAGLRSPPFARQPIDLGSVVDVGAVVFDLGAGIRCRIVDGETGKPIVGAEVRLVGRGSGLVAQLLDGGGLASTSDDKGEIWLAGSHPGAFRLRVRHQGYGTQHKNVDLEAGVIQDCGEVELVAPIKLSGRVKTRLGKAVANARVRFFGTPVDGFEPVAEAWSNEAGKFDVSLAADDYVVWIDRDRRLLNQLVRVESTEEDHTAQVDLVIPSVNLRLLLVQGEEPAKSGGWVHLTSDLDSSNARLKVQLQSSGEVSRGHEMIGRPDRPISAQVQEGGVVEIDEAPAGPARLEHVSEDGRSLIRSILVPDAGSAEVTVDLSGHRVSGQLVDAETDTGIFGTVAILDNGGRSVASIPTDADGHFVAGDLPTGSYSIRATAEEYGVAVAPLVIRSGDSPKPVRISLSSSTKAHLTLQIQRPDGNPAMGVMAHILDEARQLVTGCITDPTGQCQTPEIAAGSYLVAWNDPMEGAGASGPVRVAAGEGSRLERRLKLGSDLALSCDSCASRLVEGFALTTLGGFDLTPYIDGLGPGTKFDSDGGLRLGRVNGGTYRLWLRVSGVQAQLVIDLPLVTPVELDLPLQEAKSALAPGGSP
jgi:hypothetical protein